MPRHRYVWPPCRADENLINLYWIGVIHSTKNFGHDLLSFHRFRVEIGRDEKMGSPCIDFVLSDDCAAEASNWVSEEDVPEAAVFVKASEIARLEMDQVRTCWTIVRESALLCSCRRFVTYIGPPSMGISKDFLTRLEAPSHPAT